jgi:hypothetical protein
LRLIGNKTAVLFVVVLLTPLVFAQPGNPAPKGESFIATSIEYKTGPENRVIQKEFRSQVFRFGKDAIRVLEIHNFLTDNSKEPDRKVKITISGTEAVTSIYDGKDQLLIEFHGGRVVDENLVLFEVEREDSWSRGQWIISENTLSSLFQTFARSDLLTYSEFVVYKKK